MLVDWSQWHPNAPGNESDIRSAEQSLGVKLPADYTAFLLKSDGGEGFVGDNYLVLWRAADLHRHNRGYSVGEAAPGLILIGSDGGGEGYALDGREASMPVVTVPFIVLNFEDALRVAGSFTAFLEKVAAGPLDLNRLRRS